jgi:ribosome recycling factor
VIQDILKDAEERMHKAEEALQRDLASIRTGRASPALLDRVQVEYYGQTMPINQLATVSVPEPRLLVVQPWDKGAMSAIEKAIQKSPDLGLNPTNDGTVIRLAIPALTEERRKEFVKQVHKKVEESHVAIRNVRRDASDRLKKLEKDKEVSQDEERRGAEQLDKLTQRLIEEVDRVGQRKEAELLEV